MKIIIANVTSIAISLAEDPISVKTGRGLPLKTVKFTPKASQDLEDIWCNHIALRENQQGYRGVPGQNSRSASSSSLLPSLFGSILFVLALPQFSQKRQTSSQAVP